MKVKPGIGLRWFYIHCTKKSKNRVSTNWDKGPIYCKNVKGW